MFVDLTIDVWQLQADVIGASSAELQGAEACK